VDRLFVEGDILKATLKDVEPECAGTVKNRRYRRVSVLLFTPDGASNPFPGQSYI